MDRLPVSVILQIDLTKNLEAYYWLKELMQNPVYEDESYKEAEYRKVMFDALNAVDPKRKENKLRAFGRNIDTSILPTFNPDDDIPF